jgi:hypothetical protein
MRDRGWPHGATVAEFDDERAFVSAVTDLREQGLSRYEAYAPFAVDALETAMPSKPSRLPKIVFASGLTGALIGYWLQWYANAVSYPLNIGGRPAHATPAFFIPTFEATVLFASLAAFVGLFAGLRLPAPWHPMFEIDGFERASVDRYWVAIDAGDRALERTAIHSTLARFGALRVIDVPFDG